MATDRRAMLPQEFLHGVRDRAGTALPEEWRTFRSRVEYSTLQIHYGNPRAHYEVWLVRKTGRIEVGLHFEDERDTNTRAACLLAERVHEVRERVGAGVDLEQWTASWTRLHLTLPLESLTDNLCAETAERLAGLILATRPHVSAWLDASPTRIAVGADRKGGRRRTAAATRR